MPAAGLSPLRVGPEDAEAAEAGQLVGDLGIHNHAKALIAGVAKQVPRELRTAMGRFEYRERSQHLDEEEVRYQAEATVGEGVINAILSSRVKGSKTNPFDGAVVVLYETLTGRTARCAILYNPDTFPKSVKAYDAALREGKVELPGELADRADLREALDQTRIEAQRLARENEELRSGEGDGAGNGGAEDEGPGAAVEPPLSTDPQEGIAPEDVPEDVEPGVTPGWPVVNGVILDLPDEVREKLAEAELEPQPEEVVLPDGVEAGDPGYPVDAEGNLIVLPDEVRQQLIADAEANEAAIEQAREQAAEEARAQTASTDAPAPVNLAEVELPQGNVDQVVPMIPFLSDDVVQALSVPDLEDRSTVRKAAVEELENREIPLPEGAEASS